MATQTPPKVLVYIDPLGMSLGAVLCGFILGGMMVALDPWLRFPGIPLRVNWREVLLVASLVAGYGALLAWLITAFWRRRIIWVLVLLTTPILTGFIVGWNNVNAPFGVRSDLLLFLPVVLVLHGAALGLTLLYLHMALRLPQRRILAYTAVPVVLIILTFLGLGRLRWANQDAQDIMTLVDDYAKGITSEGYSLEYIGIRYQNQLAPTGIARIHRQDNILLCQVRLYANNSDVSCRPEG